MKKQPVSLSPQADKLGTSYWATTLNPEDGKDEIKVFLMASGTIGPLPCFGLDIRASSPFNIPSLVNREKEKMYFLFNRLHCPCHSQ